MTLIVAKPAKFAIYTNFAVVGKPGSKLQSDVENLTHPNFEINSGIQLRLVMISPSFQDFRKSTPALNKQKYIMQDDGYHYLQKQGMLLSLIEGRCYCADQNAFHISTMKVKTPKKSN